MIAGTVSDPLCNPVFDGADNTVASYPVDLR